MPADWGGTEIQSVTSVGIPAFWFQTAFAVSGTGKGVFG